MFGCCRSRVRVRKWVKFRDYLIGGEWLRMRARVSECAEPETGTFHLLDFFLLSLLANTCPTKTGSFSGWAGVCTFCSDLHPWLTCCSSNTSRQNQLKWKISWWQNRALQCNDLVLHFYVWWWRMIVIIYWTQWFQAEYY